MYESYASVVQLTPSKNGVGTDVHFPKSWGAVRDSTYVKKKGLVAADTPRAVEIGLDASWPMFKFKRLQAK
jgi:hypothetical protein